MDPTLITQAVSQVQLTVPGPPRGGRGGVRRTTLAIRLNEKFWKMNEYAASKKMEKIMEEEKRIKEDEDGIPRECENQ